MSVSSITTKTVHTTLDGTTTGKYFFHLSAKVTHRDRQEIGKTTPIASFSLGAKRVFRFRSKTEKEDRCRIELESGSLLIMENCCQELYTHALPKSPGITEGRLNLTFRAT